MPTVSLTDTLTLRKKTYDNSERMTNDVHKLTKVELIPSVGL